LIECPKCVRLAVPLIDEQRSSLTLNEESRKLGRRVFRGSAKSCHPENPENPVSPLTPNKKRQTHRTCHHAMRLCSARGSPEMKDRIIRIDMMNRIKSQKFQAACQVHPFVTSLP
jgi:hypothetical protein